MTVHADAAEMMTENQMMQDANEGICAFIDKHPSPWRDR